MIYIRIKEDFFMGFRSVLSVLIAVLLFSCGEKEPVKVGFTCWLSGPNSVLGIAGRDAVQLAVNEMNEKGGIKGRQIELIVRDDQGDAAQAVAGDRELIDEGCVAIIGHMHSSMCIAALPLINEEKILMISPTASSDQLSGMEDYFYRIAPLSIMEIRTLAAYAWENLGLKKIVCVYDLSNQAFSERWNSVFDSELQSRGSSFAKSVSFNSGENPDYSAITDSILQAEPDGLLLVTNTISTAVICQQLYKRNAPVALLSTGWANSEDFIRTGGPSIEGVTFAQARDLNSTGEKYRKFADSFKTAWSKEPDIASVYSYEAAMVLFYLLEQTTDREKLRPEIAGRKTFSGLQQDISFDEFGENMQENYFFLQVRGGRLVTVSGQ